MKNSPISKQIKKSGLTRVLVWMVYLAGISWLLSCEDIMDVSFSGDSGRYLVVEGSITTDTLAHRVLLSYTGDFFNKAERQRVSGAEVTISDGDTTFVLNDDNDGEYYTDTHVHGVTGKTYMLNIKLPDGREFSASEKLVPCADIDSIRQSHNHQSFDGDYLYDVLFYGQEPEPLGNNYMYLLYVNHVLYTDTLSEITFANDDFVNGRYVRDYVVYQIRESDIHPDYAWVTLEMHSISPAYYDYLSAMLLETVWKGSPWDGPPANVIGNISNGAKGYFRASDVKRKSRRFAALPREN